MLLLLPYSNIRPCHFVSSSPAILGSWDYLLENLTDVVDKVEWSQRETLCDGLSHGKRKS